MVATANMAVVTTNMAVVTTSGTVVTIGETMEGEQGNIGEHTTDNVMGGVRVGGLRATGRVDGGLPGRERDHRSGEGR